MNAGKPVGAKRTQNKDGDEQQMATQFAKLWASLNWKAFLASWDLKMLILFMIPQMIFDYFLCVPGANFIGVIMAVHWIREMIIHRKRRRMLTQDFLWNVGWLLLTLVASVLVTMVICNLMSCVWTPTDDDSTYSVLQDFVFLVLALFVFRKTLVNFNSWLGPQTGRQRQQPALGQGTGAGLKRNLKNVFHGLRFLTTNFWRPPRPPPHTTAYRGTTFDSSDDSDSVMTAPPTPLSTGVAPDSESSDSSTSLESD